MVATKGLTFTPSFVEISQMA